MTDSIINPLKVYNVTEASEVLGINPQTLLEYLRDGKIVAKKIGEWKILGQSLINFLSVKDTGLKMKDGSSALRE